jgi:hypothetical protein
MQFRDLYKKQHEKAENKYCICTIMSLQWYDSRRIPKHRLFLNWVQQNQHFFSRKCRSLQNIVKYNQWD